jgi:hypothetical protein
MMDSNGSWGSDVLVSLPVPPTEKTVRPAASGFAFSRFGLVHDLTQSDLETFLYPTFSPLDTPERE